MNDIHHQLGDGIWHNWDHPEGTAFFAPTTYRHLQDCPFCKFGTVIENICCDCARRVFGEFKHTPRPPLKPAKNLKSRKKILSQPRPAVRKDLEFSTVGESIANQYHTPVGNWNFNTLPIEPRVYVRFGPEGYKGVICHRCADFVVVRVTNHDGSIWFKQLLVTDEVR